MNREHVQATVTVDLVILTIRDNRLKVLLIERGNQPFQGQWALPGGFIRPDEDIDDAALRELSEETGLEGRHLHLEQVRTYATPGRDPRGRVVTVAYLAVAPDLPMPTAGSDARSAKWANVSRVGSLAFDHADILRDAVEMARSKLEYTTLAAAFCPELFTVSDLRRVYEVVWGTRIDPRNFHRKVVGTKGFLEQSAARRNPLIGRPALLYRRGPATALYPPMLRRSDSLASISSAT
ncbi:NUDIX hydrolase [Allorhizocola rhizosphaerae]|uniref:NUDIX hydrolase n=1 Tax=Allorhizocola rhizosphaerae TaxID=1872709 RepID=UPI000E3D8F99|nr:NUDIX domain-containing protein [Allorhizocola rhizosphaerae]